MNKEKLLNKLAELTAKRDMAWEDYETVKNGCSSFKKYTAWKKANSKAAYLECGIEEMEEFLAERDILLKEPTVLNPGVANSVRLMVVKNNIIKQEKYLKKWG